MRGDIVSNGIRNTFCHIFFFWGGGGGGTSHLNHLHCVADHVQKLAVYDGVEALCYFIFLEHM